MRLTALAVLALGVCASGVDAEIWVPTNRGVGADAEIRESNINQNRGDSTEIASRVRNDFIAGDENDGSDRNSAIYTKFDVSDLTFPTSGETAFRMSYRNNNLSGSRIQDGETPNPNIRTGLAVYGLDPEAEGADWDEMQITYGNAPGIVFNEDLGVNTDGDIGTKDFDSDVLTFLGTVEFPEIGSQNWLPVGEFLEFRSEDLNAFVGDAMAAGETEITLVSTVIHGGDTPFGNWINFNYLFNPKDQVVLNDDPNYDSDVTDPNNALGSPWSGADNSTGAFSPQLLVAPEPSGLALLSMLAAGVAGLRSRK